jgi:hypothetical protein
MIFAIFKILDNHNGKRYAVHQIRKSCQFSIQKHDKQIIMAVFIDQNGIKRGNMIAISFFGEYG